MLKLYGFQRSRSNRPQWALEELEVPYEFYQLDFQKAEHRSPYFLGLNPGGKVPVLMDGDFIISESAAICSYLADKFPEKHMIPAAGTQDRGRYDQWMAFVISELEQPLWSKGKHTFALPEAYRIPEMFQTALYEFKQPVRILSEELGDREWMIGSHITMVDIMVAHTLRWAVNFQFPVEYDNLMRFLERMEQRPSFARMKACTPRPLPS